MIRNTEEVIADLKKLIDTNGYIYSLCLILFEDFRWDLNKLHEIDYKSNLSVKECSLILGFLVQKQIDFSIPKSPDNVLALKEKTYELMKELQMSFLRPQASKFQDMMKGQKEGDKIKDSREDRLEFFVKDKGMVEPMFYAGDGVYDFQYLEYLEPKYKYDGEWLLKNRGFNIDSVAEIANKIKQIRAKKAQNVVLMDFTETFPKPSKKERKRIRKEFSKETVEEIEREQLVASTFYQYCLLFPDPEKMEADNSEGWCQFYENLLDLFIVTPSDLKEIDQKDVEMFFQNFSFVPECNEGYEGPGYFNILNSRPLIKLEEERYFNPINYLIPEAIYESPFYWMSDDKNYRDQHAKHRGIVGEEIAYGFLSQVFGKKNTFRSVISETKKGEPDTDIDVLCLLGNKALCVQVKSKKLTLTARRGDFDQLAKDFNGAIQDAYDQGLTAKKVILNKKARFFDENRKEFFLPDDVDEVYIMGLTTENYPSLVHQVNMMLQKESKDPYPLFLSVFDLELLVHYLKDPYDFLYYVRQRIDLADYYRADEELVYLGYHLQNKLWRMEGYDWGIINNDYGGIIDRNYYPHKIGMSHVLNESDDPIHNRWKDPKFDLFVQEIKSSNHPKLADIIFHLFDWSNDSRKSVVEQMINVKNISRRERTLKSIATATVPNFGLSYIVSDVANPNELEARVLAYSEARKYFSKCNAWIGVGSFSTTPNLIDYFIYMDEPWEVDIELEEEYKDMLSNMKELPPTQVGAVNKKVGRNDLCPCKSGKKYKKCCGC